MYDPAAVLAALDANQGRVIALCGFAMLCNYTWFIAAVRCGLRDRVVPIPVFCVLFWLAGDASMVLRYELWFDVIDHWYVKLFWLALVLTVLCELVFLSMALRFGRAELAATLRQGQFTALLLAGLAVTWIAWEQIKRLIGDPLYIDYFHFANLVGPVFAAAQTLRRGTRAGTSPLIWAAYTAMVASWSLACALWFGPVFASPGRLLLYATSTLAAAAMTWLVIRLPAVEVRSAAPPVPAGALSARA
jgi:hypothetical protein